MEIRIKPSKIHGTVSVPPSKSITHRAVMIASLAKGRSIISNYLKSDDTNYTIMACQDLGAKIKVNKDRLVIEGVDGRFPLNSKTKKLFAGESGSTMRLITALSVLTDGTVIIDCEKKLRERPIGELIKVLQKQGVRACSIRSNGYPPVEIKGGKLSGGRITVDSEKSSQFASALLLISPYAERDVILKPINLQSVPYLILTWSLMREFGSHGEFDGEVYKIRAGKGFQAQKMIVEGDWTAASYFMTAAAICKSTVTISNLKSDSIQGDRKIVALLSKMGCKIKIRSTSIEVTGVNLQPITVDLGDNPDIVPSLSVAAAFASGTSRFTNIGHLIYKESNRLESVCVELNKMGINANFERNKITIIGGKPKGASINTHNDHRIAMSFSIAALAASRETIIANAEVVKKSYPNFYSDLKKLGAKIR